MNCHEAGQFPLLQKLFALPLIWLNLKDGLILRLLCILNFFAFLGLLSMGFQSLRLSSHRLANVFLLIACTSPLLYYAHSSFSEMLAAWSTLGLVASCSKKNSKWAPGAWSLLAGLSKITAFPFLLVLALLSSFGGKPTPNARFLRQRVGVIATGIGISVLLNIVLNLFSFGSWMNLKYLDPLAFTASSKDIIKILLEKTFSWANH